MFRLLKGCALLYALITIVPMLAVAVTPRTLWLVVLLGLAAVVVLVILGALRFSGGLLMFLLGRASARRR